MVKLWNALDPAQEQELLEVLKKNQIACFVKDAGAGELMKIAMGFSLAGRDIYVDEKDANKASRLIGQMKARWNLEQMQEGWEGEEEEERASWYQRKEIISRIILSVLVVMVIIIIFI